MTPAEWAREAMESAVRCGGMERAIAEIVARALAEDRAARDSARRAVA